MRLMPARTKPGWPATGAASYWSRELELLQETIPLGSCSQLSVCAAFGSGVGDGVCVCVEGGGK